MSDGCQMFEPAPHENCEVYTQMEIVDPSAGTKQMVDVCLEHFQAVRP